MVANVFFILGMMILVATAFALLTRFLKQPLIPGYVLAGLFLGPIFHIIPYHESLQSFADIGVAFLLFLVGLELDFTKLRKIGKTVLITGTIQNILLIALGYGFGLLLGLSPVASLYFAFLGAFSSTMIVIKMLSDNSELDTLHGKLVIGFLLLEDFFALIALSTINLVQAFHLSYFIIIMSKLVLLLGIAYLMNKWVILPLFNVSARSQEVQFLMALSSAFFFVFLFHFFGEMLIALMRSIGISLSQELSSLLAQPVSLAIASFIAGMGLATSHYSYNIIGKINPLRDFFATIFFVTLGIGLELHHLQGTIPLIIVLMSIILFFKPLLTYTLLHLFGYVERTGFNTAVYLTQLSEFSLILVSSGLALGHLDKSVYSAVIIVALLTITISSYLVKYNKQIYNVFAPIFQMINKLPYHKTTIAYLPEHFNKEVLLIGFDRIGYSIFKTLKKLKKDFLIVDYNPDIIERLMKQKIHCIYGDIVNPEIMERVHLEKAKMIISTVPDSETNKIILHKAREANKKAIVIVTAYDVEESLLFYEMGADYVILPHLLGGNHMSLLIEEFDTDLRHLVKHRKRHIKELKERIQLQHHHHKPREHTRGL